MTWYYAKREYRFINCCYQVLELVPLGITTAGIKTRPRYQIWMLTNIKRSTVAEITCKVDYLMSQQS
jgi:hypothetical protein